MGCDRHTSGWLLAGFFWLSMPGLAYGFDTGHHADLTHEALAEFGFNRNGIEVAQVENWLVDYYSSQPTAGLKDQLALLHFDNLFSDQQVQSYWAHLTHNTKSAIEAAARENNPLKIVALTGMSLHVVQDFYTHSNWPSLYPANQNTYNTNTWFTTSSPRGVFTGRYDRPGNQPEHGNYFSGLNKDSYNRPQWDQAYVFSYAASVEWVEQIRQWVQATNPSLWGQVTGLQLSAPQRSQLDRDLEASYRISEWIDIGSEDGHWKGKGSGSNAEFVAFTGRWTAAPDSVFVKHFKQDRWFQALLPGLNGQAAVTPSLPSFARRPLNKKAVILRTVSVSEDDVGLFETKIDPAGQADFYARVTIAGQTFIEAMQLDRREISPDWTTIKFINSNEGVVPIRYELWDEDGGVRGDDDSVDINPKSGDALNMQFNPSSLVVSGDVQGVHDRADRAAITKGNEDDRAQLQFWVSTRSLNGQRSNATIPNSILTQPIQEIQRILQPILNP